MEKSADQKSCDRNVMNSLFRAWQEENGRLNESEIYGNSEHPFTAGTELPWR